MSSDSHAGRRQQPVNAAPPVASTVPPVPPPLPPPSRRPGSVFARFVSQPFTTYGSRPVSAQTSRDGGRSTAYPQRLPGLNPLTSQNASLRTKVRAEIAALDINQDRTHAILAGREILQTVRVNGTAPTEETNIREAVVQRDKINATRHRDNLDIHDVKWSNGAYSSTIACAATNGKVVIYDLNRPGVEVARLHEQPRQVHRVAFCPHQGALLLSASQDATVKLWDLRIMKSEVTTFPSVTRFVGQNEGIRDVRWSPTDVLDFALGTDNGTIQRWNHRKPNASVLSIRAHDGGCTSVDWHPDGKHLLSAGKDKTLKVWDFQSDQRRQKPSSTLKTPYAIANARWRPPCWSEDDYGKGTWQSTQVVTSYERPYAITHLWDLRRQYIPFREMYTSKQPPTDMLWHSLDLLWSVGRDGDFYQTDIKYAPKTIDRRPLSTFAISPLGEMVAFTQKRSPRRRSDIELSVPEVAYPTELKRDANSFSEKAELSRSSADDSKEDSFLSSSYQARHHERTMSNRSSKSIAGTPPLLTKDTLAKLNETLDKTKELYQPQQIAFRGMLDGAGNVQAFSYLAQKYKIEALPENANVDDFKTVGKAFEQNAKYAEKTGAYRTAQTWRTFGSVLQNEVLTRAVDHMEKRLSKTPADLDMLLKLPKVIPPAKLSNEAHGVLTPKQQQVTTAKRGALDEQRLVESTSNVATPIARPQQPSSVQGGRLVGGLPDPSHEDDQLSLPPSLMGKKMEEMEAQVINGSKRGYVGTDKMSDNEKPSTEVPSWYSSDDLDERRARMANWRAPPKELLDFETPSKESTLAINIPPPLDRHNSDESFAMFSASTDSKTGPSIAASFNSTRSRKQSMSSIPENRQTAPHKPFGQYSRDSAGISQAITDSSYSNSSKEDLFNAFGSGSLSESPMGTRAPSSPPNHHTHDNMEASGTIVPEEPTLRLEQPMKEPLVETNNPLAELKAVASRDDTTPSLIVEDFTSLNRMLNEKAYPITAGKLLRETFLYNTQHVPNMQHIFHLITLMKRFLPSSIAIQPYQYDQDGPHHMALTREVLMDYAQYCKEELNMSTDEIHLILSDNLTHLVRFGISPWQAEAICIAYEEQLNRCALFTSSTVVRNLLYNSYGAFRENLMRESAIGLICVKCNKPINRPDKKCDSCGHRPDPCVICYQKYSPYTVTKRARKLKEMEIPAYDNGTTPFLPPDHPVWTNYGREHETRNKNGSCNVTVKPQFNPPVLWQFCLSCGHGAHAACLQRQQKIPELGGRCPIYGCGCACIPGPYRDRIIREEEEERSRTEQGKVKGDRKSVGESGAVKVTRSLLSGGGGGGGGGDQAKTVRVVEPEKK